MDRKDFAKRAVSAGTPNSPLAALVLCLGAWTLSYILYLAGGWIDEQAEWMQALLVIPFVAVAFAGLFGFLLLYGAAMDRADKA